MENKQIIQIALEVAKNSTCLRRKYGAVLVKDGRIISTACNGAPYNEPSCIELNHCARTILREKKGEVYEICRGLHAEMMAIMSAGLERAKGATLYIGALDFNSEELFEAKPCDLCFRIIKEAQIKDIYGNSKGSIEPLIHIKVDNLGIIGG